MDGGRALRALLAMRLGHTRATDIAAMLGRVFAVLLGLVGLMTNPFLVVIAVIVWFGAGQEATLVHVKSALAGVPVRAAMVTHVDAVAPEQSLDDAARVLVAAGRNEVAVVDHGRPVSVLTRRDIAEGIASGGGSRPVTDAPHHDVVTVAPNDSLDALFDQLRETPEVVAVVVDRDQPIGLVTPDQLAAFASLRGA
jgi:CBS domain-containing protein